MGSKLLTLEELSGIVKDSADHIDDTDNLSDFMMKIAHVITDHFGGFATFSNGGEEPYVRIVADENIPEDGGVYKNYDPDIDIEEFMEDVE
jgi:hypothetical protein